MYYDFLAAVLGAERNKRHIVTHIGFHHAKGRRQSMKYFHTIHIRCHSFIITHDLENRMIRHLRQSADNLNIGILILIIIRECYF